MVKWGLAMALLLSAPAVRAEGVRIDDNDQLRGAGDTLRDSVGSTMIQFQNRQRIGMPRQMDPTTNLDTKFFIPAQEAVKALLNLSKLNLREIVPAAYPNPDEAAWAANTVRLFLDSNVDNASFTAQSIDEVIDHANDIVNPSLRNRAIANNDAGALQVSDAYAKARHLVRAYRDYILGKATARDS